jgi:hypothetical protein
MKKIATRTVCDDVSNPVFFRPNGLIELGTVGGRCFTKSYSYYADLIGWSGFFSSR